MERKVIKASGLFLIGDAHLADVPPGQRLPGFLDQVLAKVTACLDEAHKRDAQPVFLGDLFHWPRENSNRMLVELIRLFTTHPGRKPYCLVGNHDKYQSRFTEDVTLAVLREAGALNVMDEFGPQFELQTPEGRALIGASPDGTPLPKSHDGEEGDPETVVWLSHHNISFPDFEKLTWAIKELPGIHWLINGHVHRPQPTQAVGMTRWANPGNITRMVFSRMSKERKIHASFWNPALDDLELWPVPHLPFEEVFPDQELPTQEDPVQSGSRFIDGLERLAWKRTHEGAGLKQFLETNLSTEAPEAPLIWELYQEVTNEPQ